MLPSTSRRTGQPVAVNQLRQTAVMATNPDIKGANDTARQLECINMRLTKIEKTLESIQNTMEILRAAAGSPAPIYPSAPSLVTEVRGLPGLATPVYSSMDARRFV